MISISCFCEETLTGAAQKDALSVLLSNRIIIGGGEL